MAFADEVKELEQKAYKLKCEMKIQGLKAIGEILDNKNVNPKGKVEAIDVLTKLLALKP